MAQQRIIFFCISALISCLLAPLVITATAFTPSKQFSQQHTHAVMQSVPDTTLSSSASSFVITDYVITDNPDPDDTTNCETPEAVDTFNNQGEGYVYYWLSGKNAEEGGTKTIKWYAPDGSIYQQRESSFYTDYPDSQILPWDDDQTTVSHPTYCVSPLLTKIQHYYHKGHHPEGRNY